MGVVTAQLLVVLVSVCVPFVWFEPVVQRWFEDRDARLHAED